MRTVICHYHIYKNAGTSFDHVLQESFGSRHLSFDGPFPFFTIDQEQLDRIIIRKPEARAFSSHQIQLPVPASSEYTVIPVVFLRHPILRIASVWRFKRGQDDGTETARLASGNGFADWVAACFADSQEVTQISNAQTRLLSADYRQRAWSRRHKDCMEYRVDTAMKNLEAVECLGRTEHFATDLEHFARICAPRGLVLKHTGDVRKNVTHVSGEPVGDQVGRILQELPSSLRGKLIAANEQDQLLYELACARALGAEAAA